MSTLGIAYVLLQSAFYHFNKNGGWVMSSHVAMSLLMSAFPFLIFATSLAGFLGNEGRTQDIVDLIFEYWPDDVAGPITQEINIVLGGGNAKFLTIGIALALFFGSNGIEAIRTALNRAYGDSDPRPYWRQRIVSLLYVVVLALVLVAVSVQLVVVPVVLSVFSDVFADQSRSFVVSSGIRHATSLATLAFALLASHCWLPGRSRRPLQLIPGVALTLFGWVVGAYGFSAYLNTFANYSATYAGLAGIMTALVFLYMMSAILIFGAELNAAVERRRLGGSAE